MSDIIADVQFYMNLKTELESLKNNVKTNAYNISYLNNNVSSLQSYIEELQKKYASISSIVSNLNSTVQNIHNTVTENVNNIKKLFDSVSHLSDDISKLSINLRDVQSLTSKINSFINSKLTVKVPYISQVNGNYVMRYNEKRIQIANLPDGLKSILDVLVSSLTYHLGVLQSYAKSLNVDKYFTIHIPLCSDKKINITSCKFPLRDWLNGTVTYGNNRISVFDIINEITNVSASAFNNLNTVIEKVQNFSNVNTHLNTVKSNFSDIASYIGTIHTNVYNMKTHVQQLLKPFSDVFNYMHSNVKDISSSLSDLKTSFHKLSNINDENGIKLKSGYKIVYHDPYSSTETTCYSIPELIHEMYSKAISHLSYGIQHLSPTENMEGKDDIEAAIRLFGAIPIVLSASLKGSISRTDFSAFGYYSNHAGEVWIAPYPANGDYIKLIFYKGSTKVDTVYLNNPVESAINTIQSKVGALETTLNNAKTLIKNYTSATYGKYYNPITGKYVDNHLYYLLQAINNIKSATYSMQTTYTDVNTAIENIKSKLSNIADIGELVC